MVDSSKDARAKAELKFRKADREAGLRELRVAEQLAEAERRKNKTLLLRELRLARDAAELAANGGKPAAKKPAARKVKI